MASKQRRPNQNKNKTKTFEYLLFKHLNLTHQSFLLTFILGMAFYTSNVVSLRSSTLNFSPTSFSKNNFLLLELQTWFYTVSRGFT